MIIEYAGTADRQVGTGTIHQVRAWWNVNETPETGDVKRAASKAVRDVVGKGGSVAFESWDMSTYNHPQLNAMIYVRVMTDAQVKRQAELKARRYTTCDSEGCGNEPGYLVRMHDDGSERPLCHHCWNPVKDTCKVLHWIQRGGRIQVN